VQGFFYKRPLLWLDEAPDLVSQAIMIVNSLEDLVPKLTPFGAIIGLDIGKKTIGMAVSDPSRMIATGLFTINRTKFTQDIVIVHKEMHGRNIRHLIIGLPVSMDGSEGPSCQSVRAFGRHFMEIYDCDICYWDERWSSSVMNRFLIEEADLSRQKRAKVIDTLAATYILQGALDRLRFCQETDPKDTL
jgi:putative Holliday junction resolvase